MMTTKVFQRVLAIFLVVAAIFLANGLNNVANAARVQIYDGHVNDILNDIRETANDMKKDSKYANINLSIRGTHYWNDKNGFRYCESHFGDSDKNRLIFQVNNDGSVSSAWVIMRMETMSGEFDKDGISAAGFSLASIFYVIGMSKDEGNKIIDSFVDWGDTNFEKCIEALNALRRDNYQLAEQKLNALEKNKTFSAWCAKSKRYINMQASIIDLESDEPATLNVLIYANT